MDAARSVYVDLDARSYVIRIGRGVQVAPACAFYPYEHGIDAGEPITQQPLRSRGDIVIGDGAWLGYGVIVLEGVTIGAGAVVVRSLEVPGTYVGVPGRLLSG